LKLPLTSTYDMEVLSMRSKADKYPAKSYTSMNFTVTTECAYNSYY